MKFSATRFLGSILALALVVSVGCTAPDVSPLLPDAGVVATIDSVLADYDRPGSPGASVMWLQNGQVVFEKSYGYVDSTGIEPLSRTTPFRLASVTKQFTTMAVMILAERGALAFDDPTMELVPEIERFGPGITIRHLMTHTSGLPDYYEELESRMGSLGSVDDDTLFTTVDAAATYRDWGEPVAAPGEQYAYNNSAYELLALVVERASGQTFGEFLTENIFIPSGMTTAKVRDRPDTVIPGRAVGYRWADSSWVEDDYHPLNWIVGAGGIYASLDDLRMWDQALRENALVSAASLKEAWSPYTLNDGSASWYGFGWGLAEDGLTVSHSGGWMGFRTQIVRQLETGVTVIVLSNSSLSGAMRNAVVSAVTTRRQAK